MNKLIKKIGACAMAITMASASACVAASASEVTVEGYSMKNDSITVYTDSYYDTYTMKDSQNNLLLFNGTSHSYARVDGYDYSIGGYDGGVDAETKTIWVKNNYGSLDVSRNVTIVPNTVTGQEDTIEISVTAVNSDTQAHTFGARIMLDTKLGSNDYAPFRVNNYGPVTVNTTFTDENTPDRYNTFDDLQNPTIVTAGTFPTGAGKPDIVEFISWPNAVSGELYPTYTEGADIGDTSVNAIWNEIELAPGESVTYRTWYGLSHVSISTESKLTLGANKSAGVFELNEEGTGYKDVSILSYLQNKGDVDLNNVNISLSLPTGVSVKDDGAASKDYGKLAVNTEVMQDTWVLSAEPSGLERNVTVVVNAKSDETGEVTPVELTFTIPAIEGAPEIIETVPPTEPETTEPVIETQPETVAPDTQAATSATEKVTKPASTKDEATKSEATPSEKPVNGTVQTGSALPVAVILVVLLSAASAMFFFKRRRSE